MSATKTLRELIGEQVIDAGASESGIIDMSTSYGGLLAADIQNAATGPTLPCRLTVEVGGTDTGEWYRLAEVVAGVANAGTYEFVVEVPAAVMYLRATLGGHTDQSITGRVKVQELTGV